MSLNHVKRSIFILLLLSLLYSCRNKATLTLPSPFIKRTVRLDVNGEQELNQCIRRYLNFESLKASVLFHNRVISVTNAGGFVCVSVQDFNRDTLLEQQMNTDFYTGLEVFRDTLFTEKFGQLFFWNEDKWDRYTKSPPVNFFEIVSEDSAYTFYCSDGGEFGSILYAYNQRSGETRALSTSGINSLFSIASGYFIGAHSYHMSGFSEAFIAHDIRAWIKINDQLRTRKGMFDRMPEFDSVHKANVDTRKHISRYWCSISLAPNNRGSLFSKQTHPDSSCQNIMIDGSFRHNGRIYHFLNPDYSSENQTYICTILRDTLLVVDSIPACAGHSVRYFENLALVSHSDGFTLLRGDTLFRVNFHAYLPHYHGPDFEYQHLPTDSTEKVEARVEDHLNLDEDGMRPKPGEAFAEVHFNLNKQQSIHGYRGYKGGNFDVLFLETNGIRKQLEIPESPREILVCNKRLFLLFWSIGLIEVTNLKQFEKAYTR